MRTIHPWVQISPLRHVHFRLIATLAMLLLANTAFTQAVRSGFTATDGTQGVNYGEDYPRLVDDNTSSKWCVANFYGVRPIAIEFNSPEAFTPIAYILWTGNDTRNYPGRNPRNWILLGKLNAGDPWTVLHTVTNDNVLQPVNIQPFEFAISNNNPYRYFRFEISQIRDGDVFQLSEIQFRAMSTCPTTISNVSEWNAFCDCVNSGYSYTGQTVRLVNDVGTVTRMAGTGNNASSPFRGTFDGQGHTLNVAITGNGTQGQAPFQYIQGATIKNLVVRGSVTATAGSYPHAAGLVGFAWSGTNTIENCLVRTNVTNNGGSGNRHIGGIVGHAKTSTVVMRGCVYDGLLTSNLNKGGLVGWADQATIQLTNCLFNGRVNVTTNFHPIGCCSSGDGINTNSTVTNCYYYATNFIASQLADDNSNSIVYRTTGKGKRAYTVTGDGCVTVDLAPPATTYNVSGIVAYNTGMRYVGVNGRIYGGQGDNLSLILGCSSGVVERYVADNGTLNGVARTGSGDPYTLTMVANNTVIGAVEKNCPTEILNINHWNDFCDCVANGKDYAGETVILRTNLSNVTTMAGTAENTVYETHAKPFSGTFLGAGHSITVNYTATNGNFVAPFRSINNANIRDLIVAGTINMRNYKFGAGLVGDCYGNNTIYNCKSSVTIYATINGDGTHGGFISRNHGQFPYGNTTCTTRFIGCVFNGQLLGNSTSHCGGFVGWTESTSYSGYGHYANAVFQDCLFIPANVNMSATGSATFTRSQSSNGRFTTTNSYYIRSFGTQQGKQAYTVRGINGVTAARSGNNRRYNVSGITAYDPGLVYNGTIYGGNNDVLSLILNYSGGHLCRYFTDHGTLSCSNPDGTDDPATLNMEAYNTQISPNSLEATIEIGN